MDVNYFAGMRQQPGPTVTEQIKTYILTSRLASGDPLPTESALCEALGASRSSVREAIKTLSALDIVEVRHGHGTYVGSLSMSALVESLTFRAMLNTHDDFVALEELIDVRQSLEQGLSTLILDAFDDELCDQLRVLVEEMHDLAERNEPFVEQDREFHQLLMKPLNNQLISQLTGAFWEVHSIVAPMLDVRLADAQATAAAHGAIVDTAAKGDVPDFLRALADHYAPLRRNLAAKIRPDARPTTTRDADERD